MFFPKDVLSPDSPSDLRFLSSCLYMSHADTDEMSAPEDKFFNWQALSGSAPKALKSLSEQQKLTGVNIITASSGEIECPGFFFCVPVFAHAGTDEISVSSDLSFLSDRL